MPSGSLQVLLVLILFTIPAKAADLPEIRAGSEMDFRPYCFTDKTGQPTGFGVELLQAVAEKATLRLSISPGEWDKVWNGLVSGEIDVLPVVARTPGREGLVEFTLPHTETFDAFFVRAARPPIEDLAAAGGKEIVVLRSDAAHHQLVERKFSGQIVPVNSIAEGLRLIASGKHDALLCSRLIGVLERDQAGIKDVVDGPLIPEYKRVFSFAVRRGNTELAERLNQGLRLVQADGTYDRLYRKWLGMERSPPPTWQTYFWQGIGILGVLALIAITWVVARKALQLDGRQSRELTLQPRGVRFVFWTYALAFVAVATGHAMRIGLEDWVGGALPIFITFYPAVMVAALLGGIGPGLLATAVTALIAKIWIMMPIGILAMPTPVDMLSLALFCCMGLLMTAVAELHRRNRAKAAAYDREEALRKSEERFALSMEATNDGLWDWDARTDEVYYNPSYYRILGYEPGSFPGTLQAWKELIHPEDLERVMQVNMECIEGRRENFVVEYRMQTRTGEWRWMLGRGKCVARDAQRRALRLIGTHVDITGRRQAEEALRRLNETLEQQVAERTKLADTRAKLLQALAIELIEAEEVERRRIAQLLHDDLQQNLAAARMQLQAACDCPPAASDVLAILDESLDKARRLSRELSPSILHHSGLVASLGWLTRQMKEQFGLQVQLEALDAQQLDSTPLKVFLFRAAQELLFNVVKHAGVKTAQVSLARLDGRLVLTVSDQGHGFNTSVLDSPTLQKGFGLLSIKERANHVGGDLVVESDPAKGSRFTLAVPVSLVKAEAIAPATGMLPSTSAEALIPIVGGGIRVLFVDDHHVMRQGLIRLVNGQPLIQVVGEAANGPEAIEHVRRLRPDVVLMDVSMPEMDGIEATRRIKAEWPQVRVIGLSMHDDEHISQEMRAAGAEAFLSKTTSPAELLMVIYGTDQIRTNLPALKSAD